eukprot:6326044-Amphidinium_carterae.2
MCSRHFAIALARILDGEVCSRHVHVSGYASKHCKSRSRLRLFSDRIHLSWQLVRASTSCITVE